MYDHTVFTRIANAALSHLRSPRLSSEDIEDIRQEMYLMGVKIHKKIEYDKNWEGYLYISMLGAGLNYINSMLEPTISISDVNQSEENIVDNEEYNIDEDMFTISVINEFFNLDYKGWGVRHFGLNGKRSESYRDIAATEGVSHSCVHAYINNILTNIRSLYEQNESASS